MADLFESYERRLPQINAKLAEYGIASIEEAEKKSLPSKKLRRSQKMQVLMFITSSKAFSLSASRMLSGLTQ